MHSTPHNLYIILYEVLPTTGLRPFPLKGSVKTVLALEFVIKVPKRRESEEDPSELGNEFPSL
jgi:hypothetical protein